MSKIMFEFSNYDINTPQWSVYVIKKGWFGRENRELLIVTKEKSLAERNCAKVISYNYAPYASLNCLLPTQELCYDIVQQYLEYINPYSIRIRSVG